MFYKKKNIIPHVNNFKELSLYAGCLHLQAKFDIAFDLGDTQ